MVIKEAFNAMSDQIRQITESDFAACPAVNYRVSAFFLVKTSKSPLTHAITLFLPTPASH
ncbi:hypothetical protein [Laribacter hongkongensis]|uniref:hypothetical protein n=1 Tax=Laribacter hongkongensis TaxID=168471 RepID=UPI001EFC62E8|nr:hypothetical protein [Laribacter hongkongensis]MCG9093999.1 hypothetical protein [Laribacter hongkongensis]